MAPRSKKRERRDRRLYDIVGVSVDAQPEEITKAYKKRALAVHPDKSSSSDAKEHFQQLQKAYLVLKDPRKRALYDETGCDDEDDAAFEAAYRYYDKLCPKIDVESIVAFEETYKGSDAEKEDLLSFYNRFEGDMTHLLEWIPLSDASDVDRLLKFYTQQFGKKTLVETKKFSPSIPKLRKMAEAYRRKASKEAKELADAAADKENGMESLVLAVKNNQQRRAGGLGNLIASLEAKFGDEAKKGGKKTIKDDGKGLSKKKTVRSKAGKTAL